VTIGQDDYDDDPLLHSSDFAKKVREVDVASTSSLSRRTSSKGSDGKEAIRRTASKGSDGKEFSRVASGPRLRVSHAEICQLYAACSLQPVASFAFVLLTRCSSHRRFERAVRWFKVQGCAFRD
jgi:hypothetical protein